MPEIYVAPKKKRKPSAKKPVKKPVKEEVKIVSEEIKEKRTRNPLSSFMVLPRGVTFETQEAEEEILFILRRHLITNVPWLVAAMAMIAAPLLLRFVPFLIGFLPGRFQLISIIIWYLLTTAFILESFLTWYFNVYIITDERIIDIDFYSLIYKEVSETKIEKIQDVTYKMSGAIRALFNFGTVFIQTAGEVPEFEFEDVARPAQVAKILNRLILQEEQEKIEGRVR